MAIIIQFIKTYAPWIYGTCALVALWYLRAAILARRERRYAMFSLEREAALNRTFGAWSIAISLLVVMGVVYFLSTTVSDAVQPLVADIHTPTPPPVVVPPTSAAPTLPLPEETVTEVPPTSTPTPKPTATPAPTEAPPTPAPVVVASPRCSNAESIITSPGVNAQVSGMVPIIGSAVHGQFSFYKLEFGAGAAPAVWSYFDGGDHPVQGGQLGTLNAGALAPGTYSIRVVVVDASGNYPLPCQTTVIIK